MDRLHGVVTEWRENGKLKSKGTFVEHRKHGDWTEYHPDTEAPTVTKWDHGRRTDKGI